MNNINENSLNMFYENLQNQQQKLLNDIKSSNNEDLDKLTHQEIDLITVLMKNLMKLRKVMKTKESKKY